MEKIYRFVQIFSGIFLFLVICNWQGKTAVELYRYSKKQDSVIIKKEHAKDSINNPKKQKKWQTQLAK